jgi:glutathione S-transferase/maleylpyruvate isomerase
VVATEFRLYATPVSVYSCKLRLALALKGLEWTELPPPGGYGSAEYKAIVPQGTVPALVHGDFVLSESDAIVEYLDEIGAGAPLMPDRPRDRARARALSRFIDTRLEPAARALFPLVGAGAPVPEAARAALMRHLETLSALAGPGPFLGGARPGLPDCGLWPVAAVLAMLDRALALGLPPPALADSAWGVPEVADHLADYRLALTEWAAAKGVRP